MPPPFRKSIGYLVPIANLATACGTSSTVTGSSADNESPLFDCAYNHPYQQNNEDGTTDTILANERGCYVLVDPALGGYRHGS